MSRKSSWWLRPQRKGASNRAALNEANYFMEHNKVLRERIKELAAENTKLREFATETWELLTCNEPVFVWKGLQELAHSLGIEVDE